MWGTYIAIINVCTDSLSLGSYSQAPDYAIIHVAGRKEDTTQNYLNL